LSHIFKIIPSVSETLTHHIISINPYNKKKPPLLQAEARVSKASAKLLEAKVAELEKNL